MTIEVGLVIALLVLTVFNNAVQVYIHFEAYPLFAYVGKPEFAAYLQQYEQRLTGPLLVPYGLTLLVNLALIFLRPAPIEVPLVIIALALNASVAVVTVVLATPLYNAIKQAGTTSIDAMPRLMSINLVRLVISTVSSVVALILLVQLF